MRRVITNRNARVCFGITSLAVTVGLVLQLILVIGKDPATAMFEHTPARILNFFSFFTVQSNIAVAITTGMLAARPDRTSRVFRILRLDAVLCIAVTGIVFHLALSSLQELTGWDAVADFLLHTLSPILTVLGWLVFGPRCQPDRGIVTRSVIAPLCWLGYALVYGAVATTRTGAHYYAYPFMNVEIHGYAVAMLRCALVAVLFLALAFGALALDERLPHGRTTNPSTA
ncbi:MAG: hypothetical protein JWM34_391 [Ilumatobacteraceae bacterium]|nr:hypothetical protein [Ilumatobacteraceae bacterium]